MIDTPKATQETIPLLKKLLQKLRRSSSNSAAICLNDPFWAPRAHFATSIAVNERISATTGSTGRFLSSDRMQEIEKWYERENDFSRTALTEYDVIEHADMPDGFYSQEGIAWKYIGELLRHARANVELTRAAQEPCSTGGGAC